jgi:tetratricopeptide (TPR) repeat protein
MGQARPIFIAAVFCLGVWAAPSAQPERFDLRTVLTRYAGGDFEGARAAVGRATRQQAQAFRYALVSAGHSWIHEQPRDLSRRALAASAFALEFEAARAEKGEWSRQNNLCAGQCVIEWACVVLRSRGPADEAERLWQLGAIALIGGVRDWTFLVQPSQLGGRIPETGHWPHVNRRLPDEPRSRLARAIALASRFDVTMELDAPKEGERTGLSGGRGSVIQINPAIAGIDRRRQPLEYAMQEMLDLTANPVVGPEARLRVGYLHWRSGEYERTLEAVTAAARATTDPDLQYVAYFLAAQSSQTLGRFDEADRLYERALAARPHSQSATVGLAALRFLRGEAAAAYDLVERSRAARPNDDDPWRMFLYGDFTKLPGLIRELRTKLS